jgi:hypothetical protein
MDHTTLDANPDTVTRRRELKFVFNNADVAQLRHALLGHGKRIVHRQAVSIVRSLYFDSLTLSTCHAHIQGLSRRHKLRLRWYDSPHPQDHAFMEIKWRDNRLSGKHRVRLALAPGTLAKPFQELVPQLERALPEQFTARLEALDQPVMVVQYAREHFQTPEGARVTLDYDLKFYDQTRHQALSLSFPCALRSLVVIEGKVTPGGERALRLALYPIKARPSRSSKYVSGCHRLGLVSD